jgi:hypothetical protein
MQPDIENAKASKVREGFIPNPKLKLLERVSEVMRFKHYSLRTERTYQEWIKRFLAFQSGKECFRACASGAHSLPHDLHAASGRPQFGQFSLSFGRFSLSFARPSGAGKRREPADRNVCPTRRRRSG